MKRSVTIACAALGIVLTAACAVGSDPPTAQVLSETRSGLYLITPRAAVGRSLLGDKDKAPAPKSSRGTLITLNHGLYVAVARSAGKTRDELAREATRQIKARRNNIYAMGVNTDGIARATETVRRNGRVFLRAPKAAAGPAIRVTAKD